MKILSKGNYYGKMKWELDSKGILLSEYDYHLPKTDQHYHENPYFMYVMDGNVLDINKNITTHCTPGSLLLHNWDEQHWNTKESTTARGFHIEFERKWFDQKKLNLDLWAGSKPIDDPRMHHILGKLYYEFRCQDAFSELAIDSLLLQLCEQTQDPSPAHEKEPNWVPRLKEMLHEESGDVSLQSLSQRLGVHPVHISRAAPKYLSTSLGEYIRAQRAKKAMSLLFDPNYSLTDITYEAGFSDQSHFIRTFKSFFQLTPSAFRKKVLA